MNSRQPCLCGVRESKLTRVWYDRLSSSSSSSAPHFQYATPLTVLSIRLLHTFVTAAFTCSPSDQADSASSQTVPVQQPAKVRRSLPFFIAALAGATSNPRFHHAAHQSTFGTFANALTTTVGAKRDGSISQRRRHGAQVAGKARLI